MDTVDLAGFALVPVINGVVTACRVFVPGPYRQPLAVVVGVVLSVAMAVTSGHSAEAAKYALQGVVYGLAAAGLYSGVRAVAK